ncbi:MAG: radical SAM protein [bacterium]|nr:radical SAM protein [bacterium]
MIARKNLIRNFKKALTQPDYALRTGFKRLRSYASYHLRDGYSAPPETISLFLTFKCNLTCPMCGQWGDQGAFKDFSNDTLRQQLSLEEIKALVDDLAPSKPNITLFGGEPMMYKDWTEVVSYIKSKGMRCNMVTNGTLMSTYAERILDSGIDEIILSLDGTQDVHDVTRGEEGTFRKLAQGVADVAELRAKRGARHPHLNINCTIFETNYRNLDEIATIAGEMGADNINFHHLLFINQQAYDKNNIIFKENFNQITPDWAGFIWKELPEIDPEILIQSIKTVEERTTGPNISVYPNYTPQEIRDYYSGFEFESTSYKNRCVSLWMTAYIMPDGAVRPYHTMNFSPGNIREQAFPEIWNNKIYRSYRRLIKKRKRFPVCAKGCTELYRY